MKKADRNIHGLDFGHMKYDANGFIDHKHYQQLGRRLSVGSIGNLFDQAGRHLSRDYLSGFRRLHQR